MTKERTKIVLLGAGGHARDVLEVAEACIAEGAPLEVAGFLVEPQYLGPVREVLGYPILGDIDWLAGAAASVSFVAAVGAPQLRCRLVERALRTGARSHTLVHPRAAVSERTVIGSGVLVMGGTWISGGCRISDHVSISQNCTIGHNSSLGEFVSVYPGAIVSGTVEVGPGTLLGAGSVVVEKMRIGAWSRVGAGSTVIADVPSDTTVVGSPARAARTREPGWHLRDGAR